MHGNSSSLSTALLSLSNIIRLQPYSQHREHNGLESETFDTNRNHVSQVTQ